MCLEKGEPFGFVLRLIRFIQPTDCASIVNRTNFLTMSGIKCTQVYFKFAKTFLQFYFLYFVANVKVIMQSYLLRRKGRILIGANYHYAHTNQKHPLNVNHYPYPVTEKSRQRICPREKYHSSRSRTLVGIHTCSLPWMARSQERSMKMIYVERTINGKEIYKSKMLHINKDKNR